MADKAPRELTFYPIVNDDLFNEHCIRKNEAWGRSMLRRSKIESLEALVSREMGRRPAKFVSTAQGSYNAVFKFRISDGGQPEHVALRFPQPGYSPAVLVPETLENEVHWIMSGHHLP